MLGSTVAVTAAVHATRAAGLQQAALGGQIDDAGSAQAVLRRQRAGDQTHRSMRRGSSDCPKTLMPSGRMMPFETILQAVVFATNVELAERVLRHFRCLHDDLIEQRVVTARGRGDGGRVDGIGGRARLGLDASARLVQSLRGDGNLLEAITGSQAHRPMTGSAATRISATAVPGAPPRA